MVADQEVKSIGHEETFPVDLHDHAALDHRLVGLADGVASRLRSAGVTARTVQLKVRFGDFTTVTRSRTLPGTDRPRRRPAPGRRGAAPRTRRGARRPAAGRVGPAAGPATTTADQGNPLPGAAGSDPRRDPDPLRTRRSETRPSRRTRAPGRPGAVGRRGAGPVRSWCSRARWRRIASQGKVRGARQR